MNIPQYVTYFLIFSVCLSAYQEAVRLSDVEGQ